MTIDINIRNERLQYDTKRKAAKISALSSGKIDKNEYLTGEEILPFDQRRNIEQAKFIFFSRKSFEKTHRSNSRSRKKTNRYFKSFRTKHSTISN